MDTLSIILPVYNERQSIELVLKEWQKELAHHSIDYEFVVCEDGSRDGTSEFLRTIQKKYQLTLSQTTQRRGYGKAVIDGIRISKKKYLLSIDSDGQCDPADFQKFWQHRATADVLIGWRQRRADPTQRKIFSILFKCVFYFLFPTDIHDPSAPFVLYKRATVTPYFKYLQFLNEGFWWGFIGMCIKKKLTIREIPINHRSRLVGDTQVYRLQKIPQIAVQNLLGLFRLWRAI